MKKLVCLLVALCLTAALFSCTDSPETKQEEVKTPGVTETPVSDFEYEVIKEENRVAITKYIGTSKNVVVPSEIEGLPVTAFEITYNADGTTEKGAFEGSDVETVVLGENMRIIGSCAFKDCKELRSVTFPKSTKIVAYKTFENCTKLEIVDLSDTQLFRIDYYAFKGCTALREVKLPDCIEEICKEAFYNCTALEKIPFPESLRLIEGGAFFNCVSLKSINIPTQLELFADNQPVFCHNYSLETITFDEGRESIEGYAFANLHNPCKVFIPASVTKFSEKPFGGYATFVFEGDCPKIAEKKRFFMGERIIYYNPNTNGWNECIWNEYYTLIPLE